jgi:hypothetical protein
MSLITLVTLGSPLNYLYRVFPNEVKSPRELSAEACSTMRWINLWRRSDLVGKELDIDSAKAIQYCVGPGVHSNYWSDGAVWNAIASEAFNIGGNRKAEFPSKTPARSFLETHLGTSVFAITMFFSLVGVIGLWFIIVKI